MDWNRENLQLNCFLKIPLVIIAELWVREVEIAEKLSSNEEGRDDWNWAARCHFINILRTNFSYERRLGSFFYVHVTREKLPKQRLYKF